jgi:hypothetical protein
MKSISNLLSSLLSVVLSTRFWLSVLLGAVLLCANAVPVSATMTIGDKSNQGVVNQSPDEGVVQLDGIIKKSEDALNNPADSLEEVAKRSSKGFNEIQGNVDGNKMVYPTDSEPGIVSELNKVLGRTSPMKSSK